MPYLPRPNRPLTRRGAWIGLGIGVVTLVGMLGLVAVSRTIRDTYIWILQILYAGALIFDSAKRLQQIRHQPKDHDLQSG